MSHASIIQPHTPASPAPDALPHWAEQACLIRSVEQKLLALFSEGKLFGTVHTCIGQELSAVAICTQLQKGDKIFSNHRCHGHFVAFTGNYPGLIAEIMGKQSGVCGGRGGSQHLCQDGFFSNGIQGGIVPDAAGLALAEKLNKTTNIATVFIGDGTLGEGAVYESMNIASKWDLPLLIVLENNLYAQSTSQTQTLAGDILARPAAFGIKTAHANTWEPDNFFKIAAETIDFVRTKRKPAFLRVDTYRLMAHSKGDDDRDPKEVQAYWDKDPLHQLSQQHKEIYSKMHAKITADLDAASKTAEAAPYTAPSPRPTVSDETLEWLPVTLGTLDRCVIQIRDALKRNMQRDDRIVLLGEDIESPYGGAFKATKGLSDDFPGRVRNCPISEAAIVGLGNGLALNGMIPVCEIMFGDFITLAFDQIVNHASKFRYMYNDQINVPLIVRTPMGGRRGYGPTHSQSLEKFLLGIPDVRILALHHRCDPGKIYDDLFATITGPTVVIENKHQYSWRASGEMPDGWLLESTFGNFPTSRIRPAASRVDVTVVCYGGQLQEVENAVIRAFDQHDIVCEVIIPTQICPLDIRPIADSVSRSGRLLIVEEGPGFAGFGAEVIAQLAESDALPKMVRRLGSPEHPIPSCGPLEKQVLPNVETILELMVGSVR